jgi:site-specific DNA-methyltransferase (adenine-specific)
MPSKPKPRIKRKTTNKSKIVARVRKADGAKWQEKFGFGRRCDNNDTPKDFYREINKEFKFTFDPCPSNGKESGKDGLAIEWKSSNYVNPPFSEVKKWAKKAVEQMEKGRNTVILAPLRPTSKYWKKFVIPYACEIRFLSEGLVFGKHTKPIPFPLSLIIYKANKGPAMQIIKKKTYEYLAYCKNKNPKK